MTITDLAKERARRRPERWQLHAVSPDLTAHEATRLATFLTEQRGWDVTIHPAGWKEPTA